MVNMVGDNDTSGSEFILLGFTRWEELQVTCFVFFFAIYLVTLAGNLGVIMLIRIDSCLHTPMYFFLSHLSLLDICYSSTIIPQALLNFWLEKQVVSFSGCVAQLFSFATCATTECYVLAAMAYDRYVAICHPLLYSLAMSQRLCLGLVAGAYSAGVISSTIHSVAIFRLPFCGSRRINHFFCDGPPLLALSCSDTRASERAVSAVVGFNVLATTVFILISYLSVLSTVLRTRSAAGLHKAFSTCASHFVSITLYSSSALFMYLRPGSRHSLEHDKVVSTLYSVAVPMLNPLIYSLRNTDMKKAMRKAKGRVLSSFSTHGSWPAERRGPSFHGRMDVENLTALPGFILLGFSDSPRLQATLFPAFLSLYLLTALGNLAMILLVRAEPQLHTPIRDGAKLVAACYIVLTPALNPLIYSLRNKEVKRALRKVWVHALRGKFTQFSLFRISSHG
ncbi:olfactory receptor 1086-like [Apus apus]|uniref:olfactory receptor 1086-like n=1 Tax=Apus apus TaxID=8895 RepID=UPI0021F89D43|nr:olfactory receptor 1086-like [Apus apus]